MANASRRITRRVTRNDAQIALENVTRANTRKLLHSDRQQEMGNANHQAHQGQREQQLPKEHHQEIRNVNCQARSA
jgi:hypothetical protein